MRRNPIVQRAHARTLDSKKERGMIYLLIFCRGIFKMTAKINGIKNGDIENFLMCTDKAQCIRCTIESDRLF
jgi:hypothetical protein